MKCRLTRLSSIHNHLRTKVVEGNCDYRPKEGRIFFMVGKPLDPAAASRQVTTTLVLEREVSDQGKTIEFKTKNSHYRWELLGEGACLN